MSVANPLTGLRGDGRSALPLEVRPSAALTALTEVLRQALDTLQGAIGLAETGGCGAEMIAAWSRQLQLIAGAFRFCGARSLYALCQLMREVTEITGEQFSSSTLQALRSACSRLLTSLPSLRRGDAVAAGSLLASWRELATHLPGPVLSPSAMIALSPSSDSESDRAAETFLCSYAASQSELPSTVGDVDQVLLDLLRAEAGSEMWHASLQKIAAIISRSKQNMHDRRDRLYWTVMLVYCEQLADGAPMGWALAKKNLSIAVRTLRQAAQHLSVPAAAPPEKLVQEVLFQIGLFASITGVSQSIRDCFALDWQLRPHSEAYDTGMMAEHKLQLLACLEDAELSWAHDESSRRYHRIEAIANRLQALPVLAPVGQSLHDLLTDERGSDFNLVVALLIARGAIEAIADNDAAPHVAAGAVALKAIAAQTARGDMSEQRWDVTRCPAPDGQRSVAMAALRAAVRAVLKDTEQKADQMVESGSTVAALREMILSADRVAGALSIAGAMPAVRMVLSLGQELRAAEQRAASVEAGLPAEEIQGLILQWVQLCDWVDEWPANDNDLRTTTDMVAPLDASDSSTDTAHQKCPELVSLPNALSSSDSGVEDAPDHASPVVGLEQIFIQEATQRLALLDRALSGWVGKPEDGLPLEIANEAHGLAGSSAIVGRQRLHDGALALEQIVDYLGKLPIASQHAYSEALIQGVRVLGYELHSVQADKLTCSEGEERPDNDDALNALLKLPGHLADSTIHSHDRPLVEDDPSDQSLESLLLHPVLQLAQSPPTAGIENSDGTARLHHRESKSTHSDSAEEFSADAELLAVFSEEAAELFPLLVQQMDAWLNAPRDEGRRSGVLRLLHTLKGSARMAGEMMLGERLHRMEHQVSQCARNIDSPDICLSTFRDELAQLLEEVGLAPAPPAESDALSLPAFGAVQAEPPTPERPQSETVSAAPKVRNDLLERASGGAAELLVGAVRASEELQRQRQTVGELAENLLRLRAQLRELELQSESRITAHAQPSVSVFDPLEFDRYTRLQELTRMTAESLADLTSLQRTLARQADSATAMLSQQTRYARMLQSDLRRAGMQAFSGIELRLRHLAKQVASETGREVRFELEGAQVEVDRQQLDRLSGALQHLIRNAIVHGIEMPLQREQAGKPRCGVVRLSLSQQGSELRLQISDDGRGLDLSRIRARACELGVLDEAAVIDDDQLADLIFHPGLSTAEEVTGLAGRGIGMDAVKEAVMQMGGALKVDSLSGAGTCITLGLPQLLSTQQVLVVSCNGHPIAIPAAMVQQLLQPEETLLRQALRDGSIEWQRQTMPLRDLGELLGIGSATQSQVLASHHASVVVLRQLDQWLAIIVYEVIGHREVVVKQAGTQLSGVTGLAGATLQADGSVLLIMNPLQWFDQLALHHRIAQISATTHQIFDNAPLVMVVDDSLTVRRVSQRLLERHGYRVAVARHGIEALEQLREITPAAVFLDIEMPRMDGFELLSRLRADTRLKSVPVAMVTSRAAERHRSHAMQLGANAYFGKPYRDHELFDWLASCVPKPQSVATAA